jgi:hypothetical protein
MDLCIRLMLDLAPPRTEHIALRILAETKYQTGWQSRVVTKGYGSTYIRGLYIAPELEVAL